MTEEFFNSEFATFATNWEKAGLSKDLLTNIQPLLRVATSASSPSIGVCGDGTLVSHINKLVVVGLRLSKMFSVTFPIPEQSLVKVLLLHQIEKMHMFAPNDNAWEVEKRGIRFKFTDLPSVLKCGMRSFLWATTNGVTFTPEECEAMTIMDRTPEEQSKAKLNLGFMSIIVSAANDFVGALEVHQNKTSNNQ